MRPRQNGRHFADAIFKCIFLNENVWIPIKISLKFVPEGPINNIPALVQIMAWHQPGDKPLSETMMVRLPMHICVTRPQWVKMEPALFAGVPMTRSNLKLNGFQDEAWTHQKLHHWSLTHWGPDKMAAISQTFSNAFSWMKMLEFWFKFHWSLFLRFELTILHTALVQIMAWRWLGDKPLSEPTMVWFTDAYMCH